MELLGEGGVSGFSVDEVARRSGVAKTTIYRHWPDRDALVLDACSHITQEQKVPDTGSLEADLVTVLTTIAHLLQTANWSSILPSIIDTAEHDPAFAAVHRQIQNGHAAPLREILTRAAGRGEPLPEGCDHATIVATLLGPLFYRRWFSREPIDANFVTTIVTRAITVNTA
jgi:AcrR family transcriptional regulator